MAPRKKKVEETKFNLLAIDPSFEGFATCLFRVEKNDEAWVACLLHTQAYEPIKSTKLNKYSLLRSAIQTNTALLEQEIENINKVVFEEQFKKNMMMISGCVASSFDTSVIVSNVQEKHRLQPKSIRKIVAGSGVIKDKDDVRFFIEQTCKKDTQKWTDDVCDAYMVGLAYLKAKYNILPEDIK